MLSTVPPLQPQDGNLRWHPPMVAGALALLCQKWLCPCALCSVQLWLLAWRLCVGGGDVDEHGFQLALGWVGPDAWCYHAPRLRGRVQFSSVQYTRQDLSAKIIMILDSCMLVWIGSFRAFSWMFVSQIVYPFIEVTYTKWMSGMGCMHADPSIRERGRLVLIQQLISSDGKTYSTSRIY
jgi:hypothetical protein